MSETLMILVSGMCSGFVLGLSTALVFINYTDSKGPYRNADEMGNAVYGKARKEDQGSEGSEGYFHKEEGR